MKAKKMIVPVLMGVLMAFAILPMTAGKAYAEDYNLWVGGRQVTSDNASIILGNGTASYDVESKTLTLNGAEITGTHSKSNIYSEIPDFKIEVKGENKLSGGDKGIDATQNLTITGDGSLEAEGSFYGIEATGEIKIEGRSKVQAKGSYYAIRSCSGQITLGRHAITEPVNGRISDDGHYIVDQDGQTATSVTIERVVEMSGDGTEESPYQIKTYADLQEFASIVNGKHRYAPQNRTACGKLMNDIDCGGNKDWTPIGIITGPYIGHFNGDNHIIKGLSNEETGAGNNDQGLFGYIGKQSDTVKGEVKNVGLEGGKIIGKTDVGGVAGYNTGGTITNCYNTGAVSGTVNNVGGVAGINNGGTITDCYNTGAESGPSNVGGVAGVNNGGTITDCYNTGAESGPSNVGGVVGYNGGGEITNCYYDKTFSTVTKGIGNSDESSDSMGLTTSQMTGTSALNNMVFSYTSGEENPWLVKANGIDPESGDYYLYYPHLKGFNFDGDGKQMTSEKIAAADWPAKAIVNADIPDSFTYNGAAQGVNKVTVSQKPLEVPEGKTAEYSERTTTGWGEPSTTAPTAPGTYKMTVKDGGKVIDEIVFIILKPGENGDYSVKYQTADGAPVGETGAINAGKYKAIVQFTMGGLPHIEKEFQIKPAPLTITAKDQTLTYNGQTQGEGDTAYEDPAEIAEKVTVEGLQGSDELTKIEVDGQGKEVGEYVLRPNDAAVGTVTDNYDINYVNGTLTITKRSITPSVSIEGWVYGSTANKPVVTGNSGGGKETFLYKKADEPDSAYTETVPTDAGEYTVKAKIAETANYKAGEATVDFTISPADMEVTAGDYQGAYDGAEHGITVNAPEGATVEYSSDGGETWTGEKPVFTEAGTHNTDFRVSLANYKEYTGSRQVIILQAAITIKADDKSSKYGEALKKLTYKVSGAYVKGDDLGIKLSTAAKKTAPGTTAIKVSWNNNPNYEAKLVNGKYTVKKENTKPSGPTKAEKKAAKIAMDAGVVARSSGKKVTASWGKVKGASSYVIYANYCDQKKCKKVKTVSGKTTSINITKVNGKKFNPKKNLKFYVVAYKTVKGKKVKLATSITAHAPGSKNSKRTNVTGVTVKKAAFTLKKGKTAKIKAKLVLEKKNRKPLNHEAKFRYATSNAKVAKVSKKGKITAVGKGKCAVYVYAVSGVSKKIKVTVK